MAPVSQKELLELEQSKAPGATFIDAAASFLRVKQGAIERLTLLESSEQIPRKGVAPREEFVLKLLLRRLSKSDDVLGENFWVLLAHLIETIPIKTLARLLDERDFFSSFNEAVERIMAAQSARVGDEYETSSDEDSGRPTKKQKLHKTDTRTHTNPVRMLGRVCEIIASIVELANTTAGIDVISCDAVRNVLSAGPEDAATLVGKLLKITQKCLTFKAYEPKWEQLMQQIPAVLSIWTFRKPDAVNSSGKGSDQVFTAQCLRPALQLLTELENHLEFVQTRACTTAIEGLERLIALHSVLPLRSLFLAEKAQQWKGRIKSITWHDFEHLHAVIDIMLRGSSLPDVDDPPKSSFSSILKFYSIAVRAVPRPTIRRIQQEQPWLDCLFCVCAYFGDSTLPKMEHDQTGRLVAHPSNVKPFSKGLSANVSKLLAFATQKAVKLSLPVLIYFTAAALQGRTNSEQWKVLGKIVEQDLNGFIPNSGSPDTTALLEKVLGNLSATNDVDTIDYPLVRDSIIRPLLGGFAQARDLKGFATLWIRGLKDAIQQRASGDLQYGQIHLVLVWEDEFLFKDFANATKALTTSTLSQFLTSEMLVVLEQAVDRVGPTADIASYVAIATALLAARPEDFDSATVERIIAATESALSRRSDYQLQRWRFWKLLRQCLNFPEYLAEGKEQSQHWTDKQQFVSLSTVSDTLKSKDGYTRDAKLREALECFHLTVSTASKSQVLGKSLFQTELVHLIALFSHPERSGNEDVNGNYDQLSFETSCAAVILQQLQVLQYSSSLTAQLVAAMIRCLASLSDPKRNADLTSLIKALLLSEEIRNNAALFNDCCSALLNPAGGHAGLSPSARDILLALPLQGLKKSLAQKFADVLVQRSRSDGEAAASLDQTLPDLGLLEMIVATFSVSIGQPKKWADFIAFADHILSQTSPPISDVHQIVLGCISNIFDALWRRCQNDDMPADMSASLSKFRSRLQDIKHSVDSSLNTTPQFQPEEQPQSTKETLHHDPAMSLDISNKDFEEIALQINMQVSSLGPKKTNELARLADAEESDSRSFLILGAIICQTSTADAAQDHDLLQSVSKLATLAFALKASTAADLCLALEICKIILEKHPLVLNQYTIDTLLSSIAALTSPSTLQITSSSPSAIFDRLCSLLGLLLSRHRKRLGGRYHLILPAMQGLLKCLFFAGTSFRAATQTKSQVIFIRTLPSWLRGSEDPLIPKSAEHFTRLLTTICDPTLSSIRRNKKSKSNELTDETKKAKSLAGQYMQYVIMDFCRCSLHGRIDPLNKEKLMPGLYAVLDVMDRETMRGMNGAMDANGRAVWKGLYQDWERFGRWDRR